MHIEWKSFEFLLEFHVILLAGVVLKLYLLEHEIGQEGDAVACLEISLADLREGLDDNGLGIFLGVFREDLIHEAVDGFAGLLAEFDFLADFPAGGGIVLPVVVQIRIQVELCNFVHLNIEVFSVPDQFEVLHADVDVRQLLDVSLVEVAQLDPAVHEVQRYLLVVALVARYLVVVVDPPRLLHQLPVGVPEPLRDIDEEQHHKSDVEGEDQREACPSDIVVEPYVEI